MQIKKKVHLNPNDTFKLSFSISAHSFIHIQVLSSARIYCALSEKRVEYDADCCTAKAIDCKKFEMEISLDRGKYVFLVYGQYDLERDFEWELKSEKLKFITWKIIPFKENK
jgi:hypothetical protein